MLQNTKGIVLRSVKYGETSLICTIFTGYFGVQSYLIQGIRSTKSKSNRSGLFQPATMLELVVYNKPQTNLQRIKEFQLAYVYNSLQEEIVKNSIALFSVELLLRLLPEHAPMSELFDFSIHYFQELDKMPVSDVANFPLYFIIHCSRFLGYDIKGNYSAETPHLNLHEGGFTHNAPALSPYVSDEDTKVFEQVLQANDIAALKEIDMNAAMRYRLLDWHMDFLHQHTQHLGNIKSLAVLQAILH
ncbi:MAG: DNA repair protein RecO [Bacteroidetes bacterium]|nr:DNA repair protein RecO [Bacteroidota bacterium]